ncbi:MAG: DUF4421 family protein [Nitrosopumilus sp.]|nr:DUF4421 family protein [Nitrosopumilus sp.]MDQ3049017.1 DUF4421 domain-containing protein [Bacteroidota bacterium]
MKHPLKRIVFSLLLSISCFHMQAGEPDTNYVQRFKNLFTVKTFLLNNGFMYNITPRNNPSFTEKQLDDSKLFYSPHIPTTTGVAINLKGIGFTYIFKFTNDYLDTTGRIKSGYKQFQMNIYGNKFGLEGYYQDYSRFYFHYKKQNINLKDYNTNIRAYQFGVNGIFIFNGKKFSYNAAFNQNQFQKKSAGSSMMILALKFNEIKSTDLIPDSLKPHFSDFSFLQRNRNYAFLVQYGYGYNFVKKNFYFANAILLGAGIQNQSYNYPLGKSHKIAFPVIGRAKSSMGYNGKILFTGIFANIDMTQSTIKQVQTEQVVYSYGLYLGLRVIEMTKSKGQLKAEKKRMKDAEKAAKKKAAAKKKNK